MKVIAQGFPHRGIGRRACLSAAVGLSLGLTSPAAAQVQGPYPGCSFDPGTAILKIQGGADLDVDGPEKEIETGNDRDCDGPVPTVFNVDRIEVSDYGNLRTSVEISRPHQFAPGASDAGDSAPGDRPEIEIDLDLGSERGDSLYVRSFQSGAGDRWRFGSDGADLDAWKGDNSPDVDVSYTGVDRFEAVLDSGDDWLSGAGGSGTGAPLSERIIVSGGFGIDTLIGTPFDDYLFGSFGEDKLFGRRGDDSLSGDYEADLLSGGPGNDSANWPSGLDDDLRVDIGRGGANDGSERDQFGDRVQGDVENLFGGGDDDVLIGDSDPNILVGGDRQDVLRGRGGNDILIDISGHETNGDRFAAGAGDDLMLAHDEFHDAELSCGQGDDRLFADRTDPSSSGCERRKNADGPREAIEFAVSFWP